MLQKYNKYKLLRVFLDNPTESFRLRELSRLSSISPVSVINYLSEFENENLIKKYVKRNIPFYQAIRDNEKFILYKRISIFYELYESELVDFLWEKLSPEAIILYGSHVKGDAVETSDIDLFIIGKEREINLEGFEKKLNKKIHLMFEKNVKKVPRELLNNLINGIVLKGYLKIY